jgi:ABC-type polar amino acid transport system ATPase subunit
VLQLEGMFDVPPAERSEEKWSVHLPLEDRDWNIGLIVGPSGSGKSTIARKLFSKHLLEAQSWSKTKSIIDDFPAEMSIKDIVALLSSVGFSSPPAWLRSFHVLSTGQQFRVAMARALAESSNALLVVDEFTSVVDRTVAEIGSAAIAKTIRKRKQRFIAVTCHFDVEAWLQPDWVYRPDVNDFHWRELQRFPEISLDIVRVHHSAWQMFRQHHYLDTSLNKAAVCFVAFWGEQPVAFSSWLPRFGRGCRHSKREHRTVTLPDFQGVGIGNKLSEFCAALWKGMGQRVFSTTSHRGMIAYRSHSALWRMARAPSLNRRDTTQIIKRATMRFTAGFEYIGPSLADSRAPDTPRNNTDRSELATAASSTTAPRRTSTRSRAARSPEHSPRA